MPPPGNPHPCTINYRRAPQTIGWLHLFPLMTGFLPGWHELIFAFATFFLSHILPARPTVREWLIRLAGKNCYLWAYAALSILLFGWLIVAADPAPSIALWQFSPWQTWMPNVAMPFACLLLAFGIATPNPLSIASHNDETFDPESPGIAGVRDTQCYGRPRFGHLPMLCRMVTSLIY